MGVPHDSFKPYDASLATGIPPESLKPRPLFRDFTQPEIHGAAGSAYLLANDMFRWRAMSHGIPAESFAAGANPVPKWGTTSETSGISIPGTPQGNNRNIDMATVFDEHRKKWIHSYFIKAPLCDTHQLYDRIVKEIK